MASRVEWTATDYAAKDELAEIIDDSGLSLRAIADRMGGVVSHVRIGDIRNGVKAPVRLFEFLAICDVCHADPVATLRRITVRAKQLEQQEGLTGEAARSDANLQTAINDLQRSDLDIAANHDPNKHAHEFDGE